MPILKIKKQIENFTVITNEICQNEKLTYEAKGLLIELLSRPENWKIRLAQLIREHTGGSKLRRIVKELKTAGYIKIKNIYKNGLISDRIWIVCEKTEQKHTENSQKVLKTLNTGNLNLRKPLIKENQPLQIKNKDNNTNKDKNKDKEYKDIVTDFVKYLRYSSPNIIKGIFKRQSEHKFINSQIETIDKLIRIDNRSLNDVIKAIHFGLHDQFWKQNFYSLTKLRKVNKDGVPYIDYFLNQIKHKNGEVEEWLNEQE